MIAIVCLSEDHGMAFNHRRQSRDEKLIDYLISRLSGKTLRMDPYSEDLFMKYKALPASGGIPGECPINEENHKEGSDLNLFTDLGVHMIVEEDYLEKAQETDYCFVEREDLLPYKDRILRLILCRWNRKYPMDQKLDLDLSEYKLRSSEDIPGKSHDKITIEVWDKRQDLH
jgi:hypothetical protein